MERIIETAVKARPGSGFLITLNGRIQQVYL